MEQQRALQRYEETWLAFTEELKTNPTVTLRAICKKLHTNECGMSKWASRHAYSVSRCKASLSQKTSAPSSSFICIEPKDQPVQHKASVLAGVNVTFSSGTTISIKQEGALKIVKKTYPHFLCNTLFYSIFTL